MLDTDEGIVFFTTLILNRQRRVIWVAGGVEWPSFQYTCLRCTLVADYLLNCYLHRLYSFEKTALALRSLLPPYTN